MSLSDETRAYLARTDAAHRKSQGQFFTPEPLRDALLERLDLPATARILDPACGTGEFLASAAARWPEADLVGWEIDPALPAVARRLVPGARILECDALAAPFEGAFDAVVGNPPYFEFKPTPEVRRRYAAAISGRVNVYALFVLLGIELLKPGGRLAFVLSTSMTNGAYFRRLRETVLERCAVEWLRIVPGDGVFEDVQQQVMLLVLEKGGRDDGRHVFRRGDHRILAERPEDLEALFENRVTLADLGYDVRTGSVVWNQRREALTDDPEGAVRLIWSHDIHDGRLDLDHPRAERPPFVRGVEPKVGPAIVVNRVTGAGARAQLRAAVVPRGMRFVGENHVNVVLPPEARRPRMAEVRGLAAALSSPQALAAARLITGNTQISRTELRDLIPIPDPHGRSPDAGAAANTSDVEYRVAHFDRARVVFAPGQIDLARTTHEAFVRGITGALSALGLPDEFPFTTVFLVPSRVEFDRFVAHLTPTPTDPWRVGQPQGHDLYLLSPEAYPADASPNWLGPDGAYDPAEYARLVAHESVHMVEEYVSPRPAMDCRPAWWCEGLAVLLSSQHRLDPSLRDRMKEDLERWVLPSLEEMDGAPAYVWGWAVVESLRNTVGLEAFTEMITTSATADILGALGVDRARFDVVWREHAKQASDF